MQARRLMGVWRVWVIFLVALLAAVLLGAKPLHLQAEDLDGSAFRTAVLAVTGPLATASDFLALDEPWKWATGYSDDEETDGDADPDGSMAAAAVTATTGTTVTSTTLLAAGGGGPTVTNSTTTSSSTTTTLPLFTAERQLRVLVVGDSLVELIGYALMRQSDIYPALKVKVVTKVSSGLTRPDFFNWPETLTEAVAGFKPYVTVVHFGGNDKQTMHFEGKALEPFSEEWEAEYYRRVNRFIDIAVNAGSRVIWIGMPIMRSPKFSETARSFNTIYGETCFYRPAVATYIDGYALFADDQGQYSAYLVDSSGERRLMRAKDGIHFTNDGGDRAAEAVVKVLLESFRLE